MCKDCYCLNKDGFYEEFEDLKDNDKDESVVISLMMVDEFGNSQNVSCSYNFEGRRGIDECDALLTQVSSFLVATEFTKLMDDYDLKLVPKN